MPTQQYAVTQPPIQTLFTWIQSGEIAIPEIQRPFVWSAVKVRNLLDSLHRGFPVGYLITWRNPDVKLKDGSSSSGKRILIDGQQRVTALMAALLGREVVNQNYQQVRIRIAFQPQTGEFEVFNAAIARNVSWIPDISTVFDPATSLLDLIGTYCENNEGVDRDEVFRSLERLRGITSNQVGMIELASELDIDTVTEIFIRVNSEGVPLGNADFAMSKIAVNETYGGNDLRKAIDYFCHLARAPEFYATLRNDQPFLATEYHNQLSWLRHEQDDLYDPAYSDMLRVAFTSEFHRGRLEDLVALLSGRNFETRQFEEAIVEESFSRLKKGVMAFMNQNHFQKFLMIVKSSGFIDSSMIGSDNALNFAYILYLTLRSQGIPNHEIERQVRRWFVMSIITGRYSGSAESMFDVDIRQLTTVGVNQYADSLIRGELSDAFWESLLPQELNTSATSSRYFHLFEAAQVKAKELGFLSRDITVQTLIEHRADVHHLFPADYLKSQEVPRSQYNQIANYAVTQSDINIAISNRAPKEYFSELRLQSEGGLRRYGNITDRDQLAENLAVHCIPNGVENMTVQDYPDFLQERRKLMARKLRRYFESL